MQERFLTVYGKHVIGGETFVASDDTCDQRAPVNDPEDLYNQFIIPDDVMDEMDSETLQDFDNDDYEYDDITDYGVDIAAASRLDLKSTIERIKNTKKKEKPENVEKVVDSKDVADEADEA